MQVLEDALQKTVFEECGATQGRCVGWVPPLGEQHGPLVESVAGQWVMRYRSIWAFFASEFPRKHGFEDKPFFLIVRDTPVTTA